MKKSKLHILITLTALLFTANLFAAAKVNDISFESKKKFVIYYGGTLKSQPEIEIKDKIVQVVLRDSTVWPKVDKTVDLENGNKVTLSAYQFEQGTVRARITFGNNVKLDKELINTIMEDGKISVEIPYGVTAAKTDTEKAVAKKVVLPKGEDTFITKVNEVVTEEKNPTIVKETAVESFLLKDEKNTAVTNKGTVSKTNAGNFSFAPYILKFLAFIGILISLVYVFMNVFKKGFGKKTKLGILASSDSLVVLKTTYIGPKKSLMMVRAHNQVFLIASSESGIQFLSEIKDTAGIIKNGERELSGSNFDLGLADAKEEDKSFSIKEDITQSMPLKEEGLFNFADTGMTKELTSGMKNLAGQVKESVKLSDQVRKKVKGLRALQ